MAYNGMGGDRILLAFCLDHTQDPAPSSLVEGVTGVAKLVTQILKHDWSLESYLRPITSQYFTLLQR